MNSIKAIVFDTFGTVVDWRSSITGDFRAFGNAKGIDISWEAFIDEWKAAYKPAGRSAVDVHGTGSAQSEPATELRARHSENVAQRPQ